MSEPLKIPESALKPQLEASDPEVSAWASANAGSGKTHVLTQRVIKLLLRGEDPAKILCITFTKAAAATMATRVFNTLAKWTAYDDEALDKAIREIGMRPDADLRTRARRLFALALETPGGLKVQTIHAFCTRLLHQFPFESGVGASFEVMDDATQSQLLEKLTLDVLLEGAARPETPIGSALAIAIRAAADQTFREVVGEAIAQRDKITQWITRTGSVDAAIAELSARLGIDPKDNADDVRDRILTEAEIAAADWLALADALDEGGRSYADRVEALRAAVSAPKSAQAEAYLFTFCTKNGEPRKNIVSSGLRRVHPAWAERLEREHTRICALLDTLKAVECRDRTRALITVAHDVIERYRQEKARRGLLDYDDLIDKTLTLFQTTSAAWVLYKLDLGINHLLLDEAQDTSPRQWDIIQTLISEFTAGAGARHVKRTMFAVGDDKQSIFSFQGAAPEQFGARRKAFERGFAEATLGWRNVKLRTSFRSGEIVLEAVDRVFKREIAYRGLSSSPEQTVHQALPGKLPGSVDIWPLTLPDEKREVEGWDAPFDAASESSPQVQLAKRIAAHVKLWQQKGTKPGDVLILVRQRGPLFEAIIRALKTSGTPVAGADRLVLTDHIAVMDLMTLADALLLPEDDLALASVLKSPLFGLSEEDLFAIAHDRGRQSLRASLLGNAADHAEAADRLKDLTDAALRESPFTFYSRVLGPGGGRKRFLARLGPEANDALDEFLNLALAYEKRETPSLQGFVSWLRTANAEVKRDMEIVRDEVRVMTVHGAKGLEAHTVILADTTTRPQGYQHPRLLDLPLGGGDGLVWAKARDTDPPHVATARDIALRARIDEHKRLLYVAMTRAEQRLVVCGTASTAKGTIPDESWYRLIEDALVSDPAAGTVETQAEDGEGTIWRLRKPELDFPRAAHEPRQRTEHPLPPWFEKIAGEDRVRPVAITPSDADDRVPKAGAGTIEREQALERGRLLHRLVQSLPDLPPERRGDAAREFLRRNRERLTEADCDTIAAQVLAILDDATFAGLFASGSRAEVPLVGQLRGGSAPLIVNGQIDRLAVTSGDVLIADYKTNRPAPASLNKVPRAYLRQLALYRGLLKRIYPDHTVRAALIWTEVPTLMEIPQDMLDAELATLTSA